ncbi:MULTISPECIES: polymer-forming cytoskeletal protein [Eubacteriales]|uniref:Polymer-forming cytoskeletal protein n=1 Tax=Bittarella massiliensis (ex Durand et al. 2017) TaxID=1720313 RepID=A0AAQ1MEC2_9FIRM|nr:MULTISPECIES: polymer-forming cytoskeletal protein [Eubacteriales]ERI97664.1 hypothetical protein HMPREF0262_03196 [Clostridium sp. ATCC 29733]MZL70390.1 hypothetical protein [Bittarella massiliensis (ex Durand et al. 2017)]MZL80378.1 hypothetical protein [Bittarella massiliensis (ex Durand et al. 2017)]SHG32063.1 hypothetical protein SAMN05444424_2099 [Bittarella massiliensis (ex Durand et al. 2017)]
MQDTRIDGMGTIAGGEYGSVKVSGMGKCTGDLTAQSLSVSGKFTCQGKLKVGKLTCSGTLSVHRSAKIGQVTGDCVRQGL